MEPIFTVFPAFVLATIGLVELFMGRYIIVLLALVGFLALGLISKI